eukprot:CAMPEP_0184865574 /NCGR_PEP_ID=MMETSP0580-20130426/18523_1 /TAXON_ID=1118495 /ORGANISM="Dactyliosolen fragilissimus" /LENGTH=660 /DNA_ID=CAMNT_0027364843 /DNA_START=41 /DNA_END=2023 /DNA_ORIENTATION=+
MSELEDNDWDEVRASDADSPTICYSMDEEVVAAVEETTVPPPDAPPQLISEINEKKESEPDTTKTDIGGSNSGNDQAPKKNNEEDSSPRPLQIVSIGTEDNEYAFTFHEECFKSILQKTPRGIKVSIVSVVGAFRTGKSFLLTWFLRYLSQFSTSNVKDTKKKSGTEVNDGNKKWYEALETLGNDGFHWRGGAERNTTGIWMWSHPFFFTRPNEFGADEDIALLLVDTQGMFDHDTTMELTAAIFGLSTLLSSYQIYNVDKRIQEDNLQQLALFSEYGRLALQSDGQAEKMKKLAKEESKRKLEKVNSERLESGKASIVYEEEEKTLKPFQHIEFLVRDWQNFEDDEELVACEEEMAQYLEDVLSERAASDLKDTRQQINSCFESVSCYMFTHPGRAVTKKKYDGGVDSIDPTFLMFVDRYCQKIFGSGENLAPKIIHGRELTVRELGSFIKAYAKMFENGAKFPKASTMLEATSGANNANATSISISTYKEEMDKVAGPKCSDFLQTEVFAACHERAYNNSMATFDGIANFGSQKGIDEARDKVNSAVDESYELYLKLNESRNPLRGFEIYIVPMVIAFVSMMLRWVADSTCSEWSMTCKAGSDVLSHVYQVVFFFMLIVAFTKGKQVKDATLRMKKAFEVMNSGDQLSQSITKKGKVD